MLATNPACSLVTGVDIRCDPDLVQSPQLGFAVQPNPASIPLPDAVADQVVCRYSLHHMARQQQDALLRETRRVLRRGGCLTIVEDAYTSSIAPLAGNTLTDAFARLPDDASRHAALAMLDASSCLTTHEQMPFTFAFRTGDAWALALKAVGFTDIRCDYWGFALFSLYAAPLSVLTATR